MKRKRPRRTTRAGRFRLSRVSLGVGLAVVVALGMGRDLSLGCGGTKVDIKDSRSRGLTDLHAGTSTIEWKDRYGALSRQYDQLKREFQMYKRQSIQISCLPKDLQGDPRSVLAKIGHFSDFQTVWAYWGMVNTEIARRFFIDTGRVPADEHTEALYKGVQTCLRAIGFYDGEADGNWRTTNAAVVQFQGKKGLAADGKVGRNTWNAVFADLTRQMNEGASPGM